MKNKIRLATTFASIILIFVVVIGCKTTKPLNESDLKGSWILHSIEGIEAKTLFMNRIPTIEFDFDKKTIHGFGGCNNYTGKFNFDNEFIDISNLASTDMLCGDENSEKEFMDILSYSSELLRQEDILFFRHNGRIVLSFTHEHSSIE